MEEDREEIQWWTTDWRTRAKWPNRIWGDTRPRPRSVEDEDETLPAYQRPCHGGITQAPGCTPPSSSKPWATLKPQETW